MKRLLMIAACAAVLPQLVAAQVEKRVEVTKAYVPRVESASKLAVEPDMTDTTRMRPEIDYTVTPLALRTSLTTRPIRPATVTYWEFNRPLPFYLKVGAGYPWNSVLDFYATTQNPSTGYVVGYLNHAGNYAHRDVFDAVNATTRMHNRAGVAAGRYFGRHTLEGEFSYDNDYFRRYVAWQPVEERLTKGSRMMNDYGDAHLQLRFGDDFQDLTRLNFEVSLHGGLFFDHSDHPQNNMQGRETSIGAEGRIAWGCGRSRFGVELGYDYLGGQKFLADNSQQLIRAGLRYGFMGGVVRLDVGVDYYRDRIETRLDPEVAHGNYLIPFARLDFNLGTPGLRPFIEADGAVRPNDYRSLVAQNPFVGSSAWLYGLEGMPGITEGSELPGEGRDGELLEGVPVCRENSPWLSKSSVDYNFRLGLGGSLWRSRFAYRLYAGFSIYDHHLYWTSWQLALPDTGDDLIFVPFAERQTVTSFNAEIEFRPVSSLKFDLGAHGYLYNDETDLKNGASKFTGNIGLEYEGRKIAFGVEALLCSARSWSSFRYTLSPAPAGAEGEEAPAQIPAFETLHGFETPFGADLRAHFDWHVSSRTTLFAEGRNLLNRRLYEEAWFPEAGARFTVGAKINF